MNSTKTIIEVKNLVKKYKKSDKIAVDNISFTVKEGEFFSLLGPNGAGKTTTISILTTTLSKTSGTIKIAGFDSEAESDKVRQSIGVIFQNPSLDLNLTAEENIRFHAILYGLYSYSPTYSLMPTEYKDRVLELSKVLEIEKDIFKPVKSFSGGMKRKLEIIRSLMHKPKVLFLDEPTSGLDPLSRKNLWAYLNKVRKSEKTTIFLTTHYLEEAEQADIVVIVNSGKIITSGSPKKIKDELIQEYLLVKTMYKQKLETELKTKKLSFASGESFKIDIEGKNIHQLIKSIDTPLSDIRVHIPSLEDAYLEIIERESKTQ